MMRVLLLGLAAAAVLAAADLPPLASPQAVTCDEDVLTPITLVGSDPEGAALTYRIASLPAHGGLFVDSAGSVPATVGTALVGNRVWYRSAPDDNGPGRGSFTFQADNGTTASAAAAVTVDIAPVNDPPVIGAIPDIHITEGDFIAYSAPFTVAPGPATALDELASQQVIISVLGEENYPFTLGAYPVAGQSGQYRLMYTNSRDPDYARSTFLVLLVYDYSTVDGVGVFGAASAQVFNLIVTPTPDPLSLAVNLGLGLGAVAGSTAAVTADRLHLDDPDCRDPVTLDEWTQYDQLRFTITALPTSAEVRLNGTPLAVGDSFRQRDVDAGFVSLRRSADRYGADAFQATCTDGSGVFPDQGPVAIPITLPGSLPPAIATTWVGSIRGVACAWMLLVADSDGGSYRWSVTSQPEGAMVSLVDAVSGRLRIEPAAGFSGDGSFVVTVDDGENPPVAATIALRITGLDSPRAQVAQDPPTLATAGEELVLVGRFAIDDLEGAGPLRFQLAGDTPMGMTVEAMDATHARLRWSVPVDAGAAWYALQVLAIDDATRTVGCWPILVGIRPLPQGVR